MIVRNVLLGSFLLVIIAETNYLNNKNVFFTKLDFFHICLASIALFLSIKCLPSQFKKPTINIISKSIKGLLAGALLFLILVEASIMDFSGKLFDVEFFYHAELQSFLLGVKEYALAFSMFMAYLLLVVWSVVTDGNNRLAARQGILWLIGLVLLYVFIELTIVGRFYHGYKKYVESANLPVVASQELKNLSRFGATFSTLNKYDIEAEKGNNKNLIVIYLESFSQQFTNAEQYPNLTPKLNQLSKDNRQLTSYYSPANFTMDGLISSNCGLIPNMANGNNSLTGSKKMYTQLPCMTDVLKSADYHQEFIGGASKSFSGKSEFLFDHGYNHVWGWEDFAEMPAFQDNYNKSWWGLHDEDLFDFALQRIKQADQSQQPYHIGVLTLSTHLKGFPSPSCEKYAVGSDKFIDAIHCLDHLVGDFIERLNDHDLLKDTVVVVSADHQVYSTELTQNLFGKSINSPQIFGVILDGGNANIDAPMALYDLGATLLGMLDIKHNASFILGKNIIEVAPERLLFNRNQYLVMNQWVQPQRTCINQDMLQIDLPFDHCEQQYFINSLYSFSNAFSFNRGIKINDTSELQVQFKPENNGISNITMNDNSILSHFRRDGFMMNPAYLNRDGLFAVFFDPENHTIHNLLNFPIDSITGGALDRIIAANPNQAYVLFSNARTNNAEHLQSAASKHQLQCPNAQVCINNAESMLRLNTTPDVSQLTININ